MVQTVNSSIIEVSGRALTLADFVNRLMFLMPQLCRGMIRHERNYLTQGDLTLPQLWALEIMREHRPCAMHQLESALALKPSTATMFVDRLVETGLARRVRDAGDRRAVMLSLSAKGLRVLNQIEKDKRKGMVALFKPFTAGERGAYLILLEKLVREFSNPSAQRRTKTS